MARADGSGPAPRAGGAGGALGGAGPLPSNWLQLMPRLRHLRVDGCGAEGAVPRQLAAGSSLVTLALPRNRLSEWPER